LEIRQLGWVIRTGSQPRAHTPPGALNSELEYRLSWCYVRDLELIGCRCVATGSCSCRWYKCRQWIANKSQT